MEERYYTGLVPVVFTYKDVTYFVWGYRTEDDVVVSFNATLSKDESWTNPTCFDDSNLILEFMKYLPNQLIKKRKRK